MRPDTSTIPQRPHAALRPAAAPWAVRAWPPIFWQVAQPMPLQLVHLGTRVTFGGDACQGAAGQTLWAASGDDGEAGVAWDWVRIDHGVVAMADPMAVVTNLRLVADDGTVLTALQAARVLTGIVHGLPWQDEVERALRAAH